MKRIPIDNKDGTYLIPLTKDQFTIIDSEDLVKVARYSWRALWSEKIQNFYAYGSIKKQNISIHRVILEITDRTVHVDHINHNTLDNRKKNLRICSNTQNSHNRRVRKNTSSQYKGVSWNKAKCKWEAYIKANDTQKNLGFFSLEKEAAEAYNKAASSLFGEFALLNEI